MTDLLAEVMGSTQSLPEDYSLAEVTETIENFQDMSIQDEPTKLVVIMNEAFADLRVLGDFETNLHFFEKNHLQQTLVRLY